MATDTRAVPRSGCSSTSTMGTPPTASSTPSRPQVDVAVELHRDVGEAEDQGDLGELRRLELERPELEPALGAGSARPDQRARPASRNTVPP